MRTTTVLSLTALAAVGVWAVERHCGPRSLATPEQAYQAGLQAGLERGEHFARMAAVAHEFGQFRQVAGDVETDFVWKTDAARHRERQANLVADPAMAKVVAIQ